MDSRVLRYDILQCPLCGLSFAWDSGSLVCQSNHCFDVSHANYINLLGKPYRGIYSDSGLFEARRNVYQSGFFDPVVDEIISILSRHNPVSPVVLDAGCGEGSLLFAFSRSPVHFNLLGADISKQAVRSASRLCKQALCCVCDLCGLPVRDHCCDYVLNFLSPANYAEFSRVLSPGGRLIKVIPGKRYLNELRGALNIDDHDSSCVGELFSTHFDIEQEQTITYTFRNPGLTEDIKKMTPLSVHRDCAIPGSMHFTVDLQILSGRPKPR